MENQSDGAEPEQISESFICCVCLDLLYKPIILACGHVSCFWCVHKSMSSLRESHCPICRHPFKHFPTICQMLHFLLLKMYPIAYKRREKQIIEEEKEMGFFSPDVDGLRCASDINEEVNCADDQSQSSTPSCNGESLSTYLSSTRKREPCENMEQPEFMAVFQNKIPIIPEQITTESFEATCTIGIEEKKLPHRINSKTFQHVSTLDVLCDLCRQLLFRPVALNCGHVYCQTCIIPADDAIRCQLCQSSHPSSFPKVCLELDHFLEGQFPEEYKARRSKVQFKQVKFHNESPPTCTTEEENFLHWWNDHGSKVHAGVGCDSCGMYPIIGDRYRCKDCKEAIGFDLCGDCYHTRSKLPGRFNQQHTPDHRFENVKTSPLQSIMLRLLSRQLEDGSPAFLYNDDSENPEIALPFLPQSDNAEENAENGLVGPSTPSDTEEPQSNNTQPTL